MKCSYLPDASENAERLTVCRVPDTLLLSLHLLFHHHFLSHAHAKVKIMY